LDKLIKMRKGIILLLTLVVLVSCKNNTEESKSIDTDSPEKTEKQSDGLTLLKGEFVLFDDAAILQTHREFYGVYINDKARELNELVKKYKKAETDMVPVEIRGRISTEKDKKIMWPNKIEIVEILNVFEPKPESNDIIKLGSE
jgi:hypothetical protein